MDKIVLNECPRDAMQGLSYFVPTDLKIKYLNALLKVGFKRLDFGSFVSPKAIPQMRDTADLISQLDLSLSQTALLAIVANYRGAEQAVEFDEVQFLGFPLSVSEVFQQRNTNKSIQDAMAELARIQNLCLVRKKKLVVYLSMAFGNPYEEAYSPEIVAGYGDLVVDLGVKYLSLADTVGMAQASEVGALFSTLRGRWADVSLNAHLHASPALVEAKLAAAWQAGCQEFDVALGGYGGCPMAEDTLVGNLDTEKVLAWAEQNQLEHSLNLQALQEARKLLPQLFQ